MVVFGEICGGWVYLGLLFNLLFLTQKKKYHNFLISHDKKMLGAYWKNVIGGNYELNYSRLVKQIFFFFSVERIKNVIKKL